MICSMPNCQATAGCQCAEYRRGFREGVTIKAWIEDRTVAERVDAGISTAKARGAKIKNGSTTEEAIRTAFTEIVRDSMLWAADESRARDQSPKGGNPVLGGSVHAGPVPERHSPEYLAIQSEVIERCAKIIDEKAQCARDWEETDIAIRLDETADAIRSFIPSKEQE